MKDFHKYASLKTTGQLAMDLGSVTTHIAALVALLRSQNVNDNVVTQFFCWFLVAVIAFQVIVAIGLYCFRLLNLDDELNHRTAQRWNIVFFICVFVIALCEAFIGIFEKFGMDHHGSSRYSNGTFIPPH